MINVQLEGIAGRIAKVSQFGQLAVGPLSDSQFYLGTATVANTAVNVVPPLASKQFVITALIISANRDVGANGAIVDVFESTISSTSAVISREIIQEELAKQTRLVLTNIQIIVSPGVWVNVKTDDNIVRCNIAGYYVPIPIGN